jgi:hypothetical protein
MVSSKLFQSPQKETIIGFEHMGGIFGQLLMAYRPWTTGIKDKLENTKYAVVQLGQRLQSHTLIPIHRKEQMPTQQLQGQPFEALCNVATRERWCWKIVCTTCGHMLFRYGLRQLALGGNPNNSDWLVHSDNPAIRRGSQLQELGPAPSLGGWPLEEQRRLTGILQEADIWAVASSSDFPDWLGYLGLALHYTEDAEIANNTLTRKWTPQLQRLVRPGTSAHRLLSELANSQTSTLNWRHLETVERDVER